MAHRQIMNGRGAPLPPAGPTINTQAIAANPYEIGYEWVIVAIRPAGQGEWKPTMGPEDWRILKDMMEDGTAATVQRRDENKTVLLAKLRGPE